MSERHSQPVDGTEYLPAAVIENKLLQQAAMLRGEYNAGMRELNEKISGLATDLAVIKNTTDQTCTTVAEFVTEQRKANGEAATDREGIKARLGTLERKVAVVQVTTQRSHKRQSKVMELLDVRRLGAITALVTWVVTGMGKMWTAHIGWLQQHSRLKDALLEPFGLLVFAALVVYIVRPRKNVSGKVDAACPNAEEK